MLRSVVSLLLVSTLAACAVETSDPAPPPPAPVAAPVECALQAPQNEYQCACYGKTGRISLLENTTCDVNALLADCKALCLTNPGN